MKRRMILVCVVASLLALGALLMAESSHKPDQARMRSYRLSMLTDEDLRELYARAQSQVDALRADYDRQMKSLMLRREAEIAECTSKSSDIAYKTRNYPNGCPQPFVPDEAVMRPRRTINDVYEDLIMDGCQYKQTALEARFAGCLPWI